MPSDAAEKIKDVLNTRYKVPEGFMLPPDDSCFSRCEAEVLTGTDLVLIYGDVLRLQAEVAKSVKAIEDMLGQTPHEDKLAAPVVVTVYGVMLRTDHARMIESLHLQTRSDLPAGDPVAATRKFDECAGRMVADALRLLGIETLPEMRLYYTGTHDRDTKYTEPKQFIFGVECVDGRTPVLPYPAAFAEPASLYSWPVS